jgi:hypothetical protein
MDRYPGFRDTAGRESRGRNDRRHDDDSARSLAERRRSALPRPSRPPLTINVAEQWQVRWWCDHFRVTHRELFEAIGEVGTAAEAVRRKLGK